MEVFVGLLNHQEVSLSQTCIVGFPDPLEMATVPHV